MDHSLSTLQDFHCTLPTLAGDTVTCFPASDSTTFNTITNAVHHSLSCESVPNKPKLTFKLSTDTKNAPWQNLTSPDDWTHAINQVCEKKARQRGKVRQSVDIKLRVSDIVGNILLSVVVFVLTTYTVPREPEGSFEASTSSSCGKVEIEESPPHAPQP